MPAAPLKFELFLLGFLHHHEEVEHFGRRVLPLVRELEARLPDTDTAPASVPAHA
jgi:FMNH2-dependent dimethyl sulfone monooxygenase